MQNIWKYLSLVLFSIVICLTYLLFSHRDTFSPGTVRLNESEAKKSDKFMNANIENSRHYQDYNNEKLTTIEFTENIYDFDTITSGESISRKIRFVNTGDKPYFITDIKVTCGCTVPTFTEEPVQPKDTGFFVIDFNSTGKSGFSMNKLVVYGNVKESSKETFFKLYIKKN